MKLTPEQQKIVEENHNLIFWYIHNQNLNGADWYDLLAIELCLTVIAHNPEKGSLANYFKFRARNLVIKEYRKSQTQKKKHTPPKLYDEDKHTKQYDLSYVDGVIDLEDLFNGENGDIFRLKAEGYTQTEIAEKLGFTQSYISKVIEKKRQELYD